MLKSTSKFMKLGSQYTIYLPADVRNDSTFPFSMDDPIVLEINKKQLVVRRATKQELKE